MKLTDKIILAILAVILCVGLILLFMTARNRQTVCSMSVPKSPKTNVASVSSSFQPQTNIVLKPEPKLPDAGSNAVVSAVEKKALPESAIPTGIVFKPTAFLVTNENLASIFAAVSNAVSSVDNILKTQNYKVYEFSRTKWLVAEDKEHATVWRIFPYFTNEIVGSAEVIVYQDMAMTQKDLSRSLEMSFYPDGMLKKFWWADKHEILRISTNEPYFEYAKRLNGKIWLEIRWDDKGNLVSSNVYDWSKRGKPIGMTQDVDRITRPPWPTSSVEAATESWRQKQK